MIKMHGATHEQFLNAGYRERYAIKNGDKNIKRINGHRCYVYTYSADEEYQDANGTTYDTVTKQWISQEGRLINMKVKYIGFKA